MTIGGAIVREFEGQIGTDRNRDREEKEEEKMLWLVVGFSSGCFVLDQRRIIGIIT